MKSASVFLSVLVLAGSAHASFKDGLYTCRNEKARLEISYKIKSIAMGGITMPHLEVTQTYHKDPADPNSTEQIYVAKGFATQFQNNSGGNMLSLGSLRIELKDGRPSCVK